ncbi:MAG: hypothetical protein AAF788_04080 [Pseudomonadota bacterium]
MTSVHKALAACVLSAFVLANGFAAAHRMPEATLHLERVVVEDMAATAITVDLHAEDALRLLTIHGQTAHNLTSEAEFEGLAKLIVPRVTLSSGSMRFVGGKTEGNTVHLFFLAKNDAVVTAAHVLSSAYDQWTNRVNDKRSGFEDHSAVYIQDGDLSGDMKGHHHH